MAIPERLSYAEQPTFSSAADPTEALLRSAFWDRILGTGCSAVMSTFLLTNQFIAKAKILNLAYGANLIPKVNHRDITLDITLNSKISENISNIQISARQR